MSYSHYFKTFGRVISFSPKLASLIGRNETLFLSQLLYWTDWIEQNDSRRDGWIFKTSKEVESETSLTYREQFTARANLKDLGLLQEEERPLEHIMLFRVDQDALDALITSKLTGAPPTERSPGTTPNVELEQRQTQSADNVERRPLSSEDFKEDRKEGAPLPFEKQCRKCGFHGASLKGHQCSKPRKPFPNHSNGKSETHRQEVRFESPSERRQRGADEAGQEALRMLRKSTEQRRALGLLRGPEPAKSG